MKEKRKQKEVKKLSEPTTFVKWMDYIRLVAECFLIAILITVFIFRRVRVVGASMIPTLEEGEQGFSNVISYVLFGVDRFDVVVVKSPEVEGDLWVKRIIGLPGDTISYQENVLMVNGVKQEETYVVSNPSSYQKSIDFENLTLGENEYFLMGDNRDYSKDSRIVGVFHKEDIVSKSVYIFYPFDKIKIVD